MIRVLHRRPAPPPAPAKKPLFERPKLRTCLGPLCYGRRTFMSESCGNRLCERCRELVGYLEEGPEGGAVDAGGDVYDGRSLRK